MIFRLSLTIVVSLGLWSAAPARDASLPRELSCQSTFRPDIAVTDLVRRFGTANVSTEDLEGGGAEGDTEPCTVLFAKNLADRVEVHWKDKAQRRFPSFVAIHGARSRWRTPLGLTVGQSLPAVEALNRRPFRLAGFGYDGQGAVLSWAGGSLSKSDSAGCWVFVRIVPPWPLDVKRERRYSELVGGSAFSSAHPAMKALNPTVTEVMLVFSPRPPANHRMHPTAAGGRGERPRVMRER